MLGVGLLLIEYITISRYIYIKNVCHGRFCWLDVFLGMGLSVMETLVLQRQRSTDQGTLGVLRGAELMLYTMELPWRDNQRQISSIPCGEYVCAPYSSERYSDVYVLRNVPGRSAILIHIGNWAGDTALGFRSSSQGCILVGCSVGKAMGQLAVLNSATAFRRLREFIGKNSFCLRIIGGRL